MSEIPACPKTPRFTLDEMASRRTRRPNSHETPTERMAAGTDVSIILRNSSEGVRKRRTSPFGRAEFCLHVHCTCYLQATTRKVFRVHHLHAQGPTVRPLQSKRQRRLLTRLMQGQLGGEEAVDCIGKFLG